MSRIMPIVSVNTGRLSLLGLSPQGHEVHSGIRKSPVFGRTPIELTLTGLAGDEQSEHTTPDGTRIHGGEDKAVYIYPRAHLAFWAETLDRVIVPGDLGENLTVDDVLEGDVHQGDRWAWGEAILEVTTPRRPCAKLNMALDSRAAKIMMETGCCGWYCRVITPGIVPTTGHLTLLSRRDDTPTIAGLFRRKIEGDSRVPELREDVTSGNLA